MGYSNSPLVGYTQLSPNHSGQRTHNIDRITPHCVVGQLSAQGICSCFGHGSGASCNYGIGYDGKISLCVEEKNRSWCSSSNDNDQRAITIECASEVYHPYAMNKNVYASLINLCVDICKRYGKKKLLWFNNQNQSLAYAPKADEMVLTVHRWFANKACPGDWLYSRLGNVASEVTKRLNNGGNVVGNTNTPPQLFRVQIGAFNEEENAKALETKLKQDGFKTYIVKNKGMYKVQVGAFAEKENANAVLNRLKVEGYDAFITTNSNAPAKKSVEEIAKEVYSGTCSDPRWSTWGNEPERSQRLKQAGYDPQAVQLEVNKLFV